MSLETAQPQNTLGAKIRTRRLQSGLNQQQLLGDRYSESYLSRVERGQMQPSDEFLAYIAARLHLSVEELVEQTYVEPAFQKVSKEALELELMNAHIALQAKQPHKAKVFLERLEPEQPDKMGLSARYLSLWGETCLELAEYDQALTYLEQALNEFQVHTKTTNLEIERIRNRIGLAYYRQNNYLLAIEQHRRCLAAIENGFISDTQFKIQLYYNLANEHRCLGDRKQAAQLYSTAEELARQSESTTDLAEVYWRLGLSLQDQGDFSNAKTYLTRSMILYESLNELNWAISVKSILGRTLVENKEYETAQIVLKSALTIARQLNDSATLCGAYANLSYLYYLQADFVQAEQFARQGVEQASFSNNAYLLGQALAQLADVLIALGQISQGLELYAQAVEELERIGSDDQLSEICFRYATALEKADKTQQALQIYRKAFLHKKAI